MPATLIPALESLSALPQQSADEVELFPSFKGGKGNCTYALIQQCSGSYFKPANEGPAFVRCCYLTAQQHSSSNCRAHTCSLLLLCSMITSFRVLTGDDWQTMIRKGANQAGGSALTGDWQPLQAAAQPEQAPMPTPAAESQQPPSRWVCTEGLVPCRH